MALSPPGLGPLVGVDSPYSLQKLSLWAVVTFRNRTVDAHVVDAPSRCGWWRGRWRWWLLPHADGRCVRAEKVAQRPDDAAGACSGRRVSAPLGAAPTCTTKGRQLSAWVHTGLGGRRWRRAIFASKTTTALATASGWTSSAPSSRLPRARRCDVLCADGVDPARRALGRASAAL